MLTGLPLMVQLRLKSQRQRLLVGLRIFWRRFAHRVRQVRPLSLLRKNLLRRRRLPLKVPLI
jgi:hypothetical protein